MVVEENNEDLDRISHAEFLLMLKISNFVTNPRSPKSYKSMNKIACIFTGFITPSIEVRRVVKKMAYRRFFVFNDDNDLVFDDDAFYDFVKEFPDGKVIWEFIDRNVTYTDLF